MKHHRHSFQSFRTVDICANFSTKPEQIEIQILCNIHLPHRIEDIVWKQTKNIMYENRSEESRIVCQNNTKIGNIREKHNSVSISSL